MLSANPTLTNLRSEHGEQQAPMSCGKPFRVALIPWSSVLIASILMSTAMVASSACAAAKACFEPMNALLLTVDTDNQIGCHWAES